MRGLISVILAAALLLAAVPVALGLVEGLSRSHGAAASASLTCSVKPSCDGVEVAVFRMSGQANAHAQTAEAHPTTYDYTVCCAGPTGLSTSCSGSYVTVLRLSAADNAHVASNDLSYGTQVCLSATDTAMNCQYGSSCGTGYACLATISGTTNTNAHVADCDGSADYATKVCCAPQAPAVGGVAELPNIGGASSQQAGAPSEGSGWSGGSYAALAGGLAVAAVLVAAGGWYARRRWVRVMLTEAAHRRRSP
jgi:hypothetical protein